MSQWILFLRHRGRSPWPTRSELSARSPGSSFSDGLPSTSGAVFQSTSILRNPLERNRVHWISPQGMRVADNRRHMNSRPFSLTLPHDPLGLEAKRYHAKVPHLRSSTHAARAQPPHHLREETVPGGRPALLPSSRAAAVAAGLITEVSAGEHMHEFLLLRSREVLRSPIGGRVKR